MAEQRCSSRELASPPTRRPHSPQLRRACRAVSRTRSTIRQLQEHKLPQRQSRKAICCFGVSKVLRGLFPFWLKRVATAAQPPRPIAGAATDPWPDKLRPHLPKPVEPTPA